MRGILASLGTAAVGAQAAVLFLITVHAALGADVVDKQALIERDRKQIEGTWQVVELVVNGNRATEADVRKLTVINGSDGSWELLAEGKHVTRGDSTFDPTKTPKTLDFSPTEGDQAGQQFFGIYELGEDTRRMCFANLGGVRPGSFESTAGSGVICLKFERVKGE